MTEVSTAVNNKIESYLKGSSVNPCFISVGNGDAAALVRNCGKYDKLEKFSIQTLCVEDDKRPDVGVLIGELERMFKEKKGLRLIVFGLGEYLAFRGEGYAQNQLYKLFRIVLPDDGKLIFPLRRMRNLLHEITADPRKKKFYFDGLGTNSDHIEVVIYGEDCPLTTKGSSQFVKYTDVSGQSQEIPVYTSFRKFLEQLALGLGNYQGRPLAVQTLQEPGVDTLLSIKRIDNAFETISEQNPSLKDLRDCGTDDEWRELGRRIAQLGSLNAILQKEGLLNPVDLLKSKTPRPGVFEDWLWFLALQQKHVNHEIPEDSYLGFVLNASKTVAKFRSNLLMGILDVQHDDPRFKQFFAERSQLVDADRFADREIEEYIEENRRSADDAIYRLTDGSIEERREILAQISQRGWNNVVGETYRDLAAYNSRESYIHAWDDESSRRITRYFNQYREQKLTNKQSSAFLEEVNALASSSYYRSLDLRDDVVRKLAAPRRDDEKVTLFWLDAFGAEFLPFAESLAQEFKLSLRATIARANLPTITECNKQFFLNWQERDPERYSCESSQELDDILHQGIPTYNGPRAQYASYLADELEVVRKIVRERIVPSLNSAAGADRVILVGDHGATRLAVLHGQDCQYDAGVNGSHSGRCCKVGDVEVNEDEVAGLHREGEWLAFANYTRFKGSRRASVEAHGGATLEEIVVPVLEFTLRDSNRQIQIEVTTPQVSKRDSLKALKIFVKGGILANPRLRIVLDGNCYDCLGKSDGNDYNIRFQLPEQLKKLAHYKGQVFDGAEMIGEVVFELVSATKTSNDDSDFFDF